MQPKTKMLSKGCISVLTGCFLTINLLGQSTEKFLSKIYFQAEAGVSTRSGLPAGFGLQAITKNNWTGTVSYHTIDLEPKNLPRDYSAGTTIVFFIPIPQKKPSVDMKIITFGLGRNHPLGKNTWLTTEGGISFVKGKKIEFTKDSYSQSTWIFIAGEIPSNYTYTRENETGVGAMLKADLHWAFASFAGLGAGVFTNINSIQSPVGFQLKLIVGRTGRK